MSDKRASQLLREAGRRKDALVEGSSAPCQAGIMDFREFAYVGVCD